MDIIRQLGSSEGIPAEAIRAATADRATVTPLLVDALEKCEPGEVEERGLFFAFHLLGQWREKSAYRPLARFLRRPGVDRILGDAITSTCHRVMANVFDGDPNPIYEVIRDTEADEFLRGRMFDSLVLLAFRGEFDRTELAGFLRASFDELRPRDYSMVWDGWQRAVALLAMDEFEPLVRKAFESGFIDPMVTSFKHFRDDLRRARAGGPLDSWYGSDYEPFGDVIDEMSTWAGFQPKQPAYQAADGWRPDPWSGMPARNPFRDVGRNDPCPCGSGKKFKKCCLGKPEAELRAIAASDDVFEADEFEDFDDIDKPIGDYDPLVEPDPDDWRAADEQQRIDVIERYHRREGIDMGRSGLHATVHAIVENQIAEGDELPIRRTLSRLMAEGLDRHEAIHAIGSVLVGYINDLVRKAKSETSPAPQPGNNAAYFAELEQLTAESWRSG